MDIPAYIILNCTYPTFAGALLATGTYFKMHKSALKFLRKLISRRRLKCCLPYPIRKMLRTLRRSALHDKPKSKNPAQVNNSTEPQHPIITHAVKDENDPQNVNRRTKSYISPKCRRRKARNNAQKNKSQSDILRSYNVNLTNNFSTAIPFWKQVTATKIAEGSFGEVYTVRHADGTCRILKCVAIDGQHPYDDSTNITISMAMPDIVCSVCLSKLTEGPDYIAPNFPKVYSINYVKDTFPEEIMRTWWEFYNSSERLVDPPEHHRPDLYPVDQKFLTIESSFCGHTITKNDIQNPWLGLSIMTQVVSALGVAEEAYQFEHRDLHLGNILLQPTACPSLKYTIRKFNFAVQTLGSQVFIIDFTLSRIADNGNAFCSPIEKDSIDDSPNEYRSWTDFQEIYGLMANLWEDDWQCHWPKTNLYWLKFLNETILQYIKSNNPQFCKLAGGPAEHGHMEAVRILEAWSDNILHFNTVTEFLLKVVLKRNSLVNTALQPTFNSRNK